MENSLAPSRSFAPALSAISLSLSKNSSQYKTFLDANGIFAECLHKIRLAPLDYAISSFSSLDSEDPESQKAFSKALLARFLVTYQYEDLRKALSLVLDTRKNDKSGKPTPEESLAAKRVFTNFRLSFDLELIENCLNLFREIPKYPYDAISSQCLASCLLIRYHCTPQMTDVDEAIDILRQLLKTCPSSQRLFPFYTLAAALLLRVIGTSSAEDIEQINSVLSSVVEAEKDRNALLRRVRACLFNKEDQEDQLPRDTAISLFEEAIAFLPLRHPDRPILLNDLARALPNSTISDTEYAIALLNDALRFYPTDDPPHGAIAWRLAKRFLELYSLAHEAEYIDSGMDAFRVAASCERSKVSVRYTAAREWAKAAHKHRHPSALEAYDRLMGLLPRLSLLESGDPAAVIPGGIACSAAGYAIAAGKLEKAVEFLESRGIFWSRVLRLRTPLEELSVVSSSLFEKFRRVLEELEGTSSFDDDLPEPEEKQVRSESDQQNLYSGYHQILGEIRKLGGFQDFLLPKSMAKIYSAASNGPIVVFTASPESGCDALIVRSNEVLHVPLRGISFVEIRALRTLMQIISYPNGSRSAFAGSVDATLSDLVPLKTGQVTAEDRIRALLSILWTQVVQPVINALELERSDTPPRIWFCPTGPFASLPIHAAGTYGESSNDCVSDYVICSYTVTLGALIQRPPSSTDRFKMFVATKPEDVVDENLPEIKPYIPAKSLVVSRNPSIRNVLDNLADASIVHLACQAKQFPSDPARSLFAVSDGNLEIAQMVNHPLPRARLAILSSCDAALGDDELPNEVLDIGGAMQLAGFRSVVTTIWTSYEHDIPRIVEDFYFRLFSSVDQNSGRKERACFSGLRRIFKSRASSTYCGPDTSQSAQALHLAVAGLRSQEDCPLERWVPFIHLGM